MEEFERAYYSPICAIEQQLRDQLMEGKHHYEAELKEQRRTAGHPAHAPPAEG